MSTTLRIPVPTDYRLGRDYCSYGYFLLTPNHWHVDSQSLTTTLDPAAVGVKSRSAVTVRMTQGNSHRAGEPLTVKADRSLSKQEKTAVVRMLSRMLRLDEDSALIAAFHKADPRWKKPNGVGAPTGAKGRGRLMRSPTFFEDVIKTVTSCNVTWPSTIIMNRRLCEVVGRKSPSGLSAFPTAAALASMRPASLRGRCNVGYRDARIVQLARMFSPGRAAVEQAWFEDPATPDDSLHDALLEWPGIGPYAAANIMQLLGRYSRLPLDTESLRHAKTLLGFRGTDRKIMARLHRHYEPFGPHRFRSYWFEMWEYYEAKRGPAWTWERETTGKTFTAALLKESGKA